MPLFSRKREKEETKRNTSENVNWHENEQVNPMYEGNTGARERKSTGANISIARLYDELYASQKGGLSKKNSDYYNEVSGNLVHVLSLLSHSLPDDFEHLYMEFENIQKAYENLISSSQRYLKRKSFSSKGQARQEIVAKIMEQAKTDVESLADYFRQHLLLPKAERATRVGEALNIARRRKIRMKKKDSECEHVGGAASHLTVLNKEDLENSNESGFYKEQEIFTYRGVNKDVDLLIEIMERARKTAPISDSLYQKACLYAKEQIKGLYDYAEQMGDILYGMKEVSSNKEFRDFVNDVRKMCSAWDTTDENVNKKGFLNMGLKEGESINLSNRNVATSRVAEALGVGNLIAKSETVEMIEPGQKNGRIGNFMQKAKGKEASKLAQEYQDREIDKHEKNNTAITDSNLMAQKITGNFKKQMANLQVFDFLTGQIDRHAGNYFIQEDEHGDMTGVTGIDNDFSFGNAKAFSNNGIIGVNGRSVVSLDGDLTIPHMGKEFANRILAFTKEQLKFLLVDLLEPKAIEWACERLEILKKAITKAMQEDEKVEDEGKKVFLEDEKYWNASTLEDLCTAGNGSTTYMGELLKSQKASFIKQRQEERNVKRDKIKC